MPHISNDLAWLLCMVAIVVVVLVIALWSIRDNERQLKEAARRHKEILEEDLRIRREIRERHKM
jgi:uncharacterized membrane protein